MKKSTLSKIILALVLVALVCSLFACGKKESSGGNSTTTKDPVVLDAPVLTVSGGTVTWTKVRGAASYEYVIYGPNDDDEDTGTTKKLTLTLTEGQTVKVRAITSDEKAYKSSDWSELGSYEATIQDQLVSLVSGIQGITDVLKSVEGANDKLVADLSIGGYVKSASSGMDNSIDLEAKANASKSSPAFMVSFKLNKKDYVSIGYKDGCLLVREPINFINTDETTPNAFAIDVSALDPSVKALVGFALDLISEKSAAIDMSTITSTVKGIMQGLGSTLDLRELIAMDEKDTSVSLGIKIGLLDTAISMLPTLLKDVDVGALVDTYVGYANKALTTIGMDELSINGKPLTWANITGAISAAAKAVEAAKSVKGADLSAIKESLVFINVSYTNSKKTTINGLDLKVDLSVLRIQGIDYEAGLAIGLPTFSKTGSVTIDATPFTKQDLVIDLDGALPVKGLDAKVQGVVRLSDGLKNKNNKWATVTVKANDTEKAAVGYIDATGAYVDFSGIYTLLGVSETIPAKFKANYMTDDQGNALNIIDKLNAAVEEYFAPAASSNAAPRSWDEYELDLDAIIDGFSAASDKIDFVCGYIYNNFVTIIDQSVNEKANAGQADLISWAFNFKLGNTDTAAKDYVLFYKNATSFEGLWENIKAQHKLGEAALQAATVSAEKTAGIQLRKDGENNDLLDYLAYFVLIPTIGEGNEPDFDNRVAPSDTEALKAWLDWIFPRKSESNPDGNDYRNMVEEILGIKLDEIIDNGLYLEAIGGTGLSGSVRAAASSEEDAVEYVSLTAGIDIKASAAVAVDAIEGDFVLFTDKNDVDEYVIQQAGNAMLSGLRTFRKAA